MRGVVWRGKVWLGGGELRLGMAWLAETWNGGAGCGMAWPGKVWFGMVNLYTFLMGMGQGVARLAEAWRGLAWSGTVRHGLVWLLLCGGLMAADITLTVDPPQSSVSAYRIYIGVASSSYFTFVEFPETNQFLISVTNNKVYLACSAVSYELGESDLSEEITVQVFSGWVQLGDSPTGPWTNYQSVSVPIEITEPARFVRVKLTTE